MNLGIEAKHHRVQLIQPAHGIPTEVVRSTLTKVFRILEDETLKDPAKFIPRRHMLKEVIASHFVIARTSSDSQVESFPAQKEWGRSKAWGGSINRRSSTPIVRSALANCMIA